LSFFDEADAPTRAAPRARRPALGGPGGPSDDQQILIRRIAAGAVIVVVLILIVVGIHSCQVSSRNSALRDYNRNVGALIQQSDSEVGAKLFSLLTSGQQGSATDLQNSINEVGVTADEELKRAKSLDVPDEAKGAQSVFLLVLQLRRDGVQTIAREIQPAVNAAGSASALDQIAVQMRLFNASEVLYVTQVAPKIASAFKSAGIGGETIANTHFLPDLGWESPSFVASQIGAQGGGGGAQTKCTGTCGHSLDSVSVGSTTLQAGSANTIPASPTPIFTVKFTNGGDQAESNVVVKVIIRGPGKPIEVDKTVSQTQPGQQASVAIPLGQTPPRGTVTIEVTVSSVPGETNTQNNPQSFPALFQ
jgi:hypothetical protein